MRKLTVNDGLPQGLVRGMVQDRQGFIWMISEGLSRYDGRNFINYKHSVDDTASITGNDIQDLQIDDKDNLWMVYSSREVDVLNAATGKMRHLTNEPAFRWMKSWAPDAAWGFTVRQIAGRYFAAYNGGLATFNAATGYFRRIPLPTGESLMDIGSDEAGWLVVATTRSLYRLQNDGLQPFYHFPAFPDSVYKAWNIFLTHRKVVGTIPKSNGKWVIPAVGGVYMYDPATNSGSYTGNPQERRFPHAAVQTTDGSVYYSFNTGLYKLHSNAPPELIAGNDGDGVLYENLLADRSGVIWASANVSGLRLFDLQHHNFHSFFAKDGFARTVLQPWLPDTAINGLYDSYGIRSIKDTGGNTFVLNHINYHQNGVYKSQSWNLYRLQGSKAIRYPLDDSDRYIMLFTFDRHNECWGLRFDFKTVKRSLVKINLQTGLITPFVHLSENWIGNIYLVSMGDYICYLREEDLRLYHTATGRCRIFSKAQLGIGTMVLMALPDRHQPNVLWIATKGDGIVKLDIATGKTVHYNETTGLPNNTVYYMAPDKEGRFWCSSNKGLFRFNPADGSVVAFVAEDGLQGNEFNRYHFLETPDGHFWFGGTEGVTVFHPDSIYLDSYETPVAITDVQVNNMPLQQVAPQWSHSVVSSLLQLTLAYNQNYLGFSFAGLQYNKPEKLQYRYMLENIDKNWIYTGNDATAKYASIPPGHYRLKVNAANTAGKWSSQIQTLDIIITPPWWRTGWAYLIYALLITGIGYALYSNWLQRVKARQQVILKQKEAEQAHALEETKSRFFANITHELRTPLTLILSPVQQQLQQGGTVSPQLLQGVYQNSQTLLRLINQLLDMSKLEGGRMPLTLHRGHVVQFIESLLPPFRQQAAVRHITFLFSVNEERKREHLFPSPVPEHSPAPAPVCVFTNRNTPGLTPLGEEGSERKEYVPVRGDTNRGSEERGGGNGDEKEDKEHLFDSDKLEKVLYNLLSNAFKFTPDGGEVSCQLAVHQWSVASGQSSIHSPRFQPGEGGGDIFKVKISDTGIGIAAEHLPHIFDRFYQVNTSTTRRYEGTGIGLSLVKEFVDLMCGTIQAESTPGSGSVFTLTLPMAIASGSKVAVAATHPEAVETIAAIAEIPESHDENKPLVLVTDDNEQLRRFIATSLAPHYRVITAENGNDGLQKANAELPELIISDVMMPVMDGYEFCQRVKENPLTSHIGFILLTAKTADESRVSGLRLGADYYIGKPFMVQELLLVTGNLLKSRQHLRELYSNQLQQPAEKLPPVKEIEDPFLQSVYTIIERNLDSDKLDVDFLAGEMAVSRRTLNRRLATAADTSANELIRNYRLKKAAGLLLSGQGVSEAAYATGFSTPSWFSQCFKEMYGQSPLQWAENSGMSQN